MRSQTNNQNTKTNPQETPKLKQQNPKQETNQYSNNEQYNNTITKH